MYNKRMKSRILLVRNGIKYHVADLDYNKRDASIYLFVKNHSSRVGKYGFATILNGHFRIDINSLAEEREFSHFSVHGTGQSHTKTQDGEYKNIQHWIPLPGLKQARHLWTMVLPDIANMTQVSVARIRDANIDYPEFFNGGVVDFLAMPKGVNFKFNVEYIENNSQPTKHVFGQYIWELDEYRLMLFARSSDKHVGSPERTLKISLEKNSLPFVTKIGPSYVEGEVATLVHI